MATRQSNSPKNLLSATYAPVEAVKRGQKTNISLSADAIRINMNNWMAKLTLVPNVHEAQSLIGRINSFFLSSPLYGALTLNPNKMYHEYLCEFWYTAGYDESTSSIVWTLKQGTRNFSLTVDTLRDILQMDYFANNELAIDLPTGINFREVCRQMGHTEIVDEHGQLLRKGTIYMSRLPDSWRYFFTHIVECLGGGSGGLDQINQTQLQIAYCLWIGARVDFAQIIFNDLAERLKGRGRKPHVPYIRFLSLIFRRALGDEYDYQTTHFSMSEYMRDLASLQSTGNEVDIPQAMITNFVREEAERENIEVINLEVAPVQAQVVEEEEAEAVPPIHQVAPEQQLPVPPVNAPRQPRSGKRTLKLAGVPIGTREIASPESTHQDS